jgi:integrative and conjugative element protein (TIGR02256 family)
VTKLLLPTQILGKIDRHGRTWPLGRERGGLLLGHRKADAIQLTSATFPNAWDQGAPTRFYRSERGHCVIALRAWLKSGMTVDWVGEWHTHPGGSAAPSFIDRRYK